MRCYNCSTSVEYNGMDELTEDQSEAVTEHYGLIALRGPADMFAEDGWVVICDACIQRVADPWTYISRSGMSARIADALQDSLPHGTTPPCRNEIAEIALDVVSNNPNTRSSARG